MGADLNYPHDKQTLAAVSIVCKYLVNSTNISTPILSAPSNLQVTTPAGNITVGNATTITLSGTSIATKATSASLSGTYLYMFAGSMGLGLGSVNMASAGVCTFNGIHTSFITASASANTMVISAASNVNDGQFLMIKSEYDGGNYGVSGVYPVLMAGAAAGYAVPSGESVTLAYDASASGWAFISSGIA